MKQILLAALFLAMGPVSNAAPTCAPVTLAIAEKGMPAAFRGKPFRVTSANFARAYTKACAEGLLKIKSLSNAPIIYVINAPDSNEVGIYRSGKRTVLEYYFVDHDGKVNVPSADDLHEAIYCSVHGASEKEQEESGRCLPD